MIKKIISSILLLIMIPTISFANNSVYKLNSNYVAVQNQVFNKLVANEKMVEIYENQIKLLEENINGLEELSKEKTKKYEDQIHTLQLTIEAKDAIIATQKDSINQYKNLEMIANANSNKIKKMQRLNVVEKIFIAGMATAAAITAKDSGTAIAFGTAGLLGCCINW